MTVYDYRHCARRLQSVSAEFDAPLYIEDSEGTS